MANPLFALNPAPPKRPRFAPDKNKVACAGQGCADREQCMRYRRHAAFLQRWASFDLERQKIDPRFCPAFEKI